MNWEILIVPLIALGVWILSTVFRGAEEAKDRTRREGTNDAAPPRRPSSELDRFLEEARRRREKGQQRIPPPEQEAAREPLRDLPAAVLPPASPPPPEPRKREPRPAETPRKREAAPASSARVPNETPKGRIEDRPSFANPVEQSRPMVALPTSMETPQIPALPTPTMNTPATSSDKNRRDASPLRAALSSMLRDRKSLATAFILHEILDKPVAMRREGKG